MQKVWRIKSSTFLLRLVVISLQSELKPTIELAKTIQQWLLNSQKGKISSKCWVSRRTFKIKKWMLTCLGKTNFINRSLFPYCKVLWSKSKKLHSLGKIFSFYFSGDGIKIKIDGNSSLLSITHVDDFRKYFPDIDLLKP